MSILTIAVPLVWGAEATASPAIHLKPIVSGLVEPIDLQVPRDGSRRLFIVEQVGTIRIAKGRTLLTAPFLDISAVVESGGEKGLLGLAFHPKYRTNGRFFVNYTRRIQGQLQTVVAEYQVSANNPDLANAGSERIMLVVDQPFDNHNGGQLAFGPDGYLYIGLGDGGSGGDPHRNGQSLSTLLGKMLRIDVNSGSPYGLPSDNPFVGTTGARGEIWAYGLRNPWRFSFDNRTKRLFAGDVGQDAWEEIDLITKGGNFGWNIMEGNHSYLPSSGGTQAVLSLPIAEYPHPEGEAVVGGYVYRGRAIPLLNGMYIFGDFAGGQIWSLQETTPGNWERALLLSTGLGISAFGRGPGGELLVLDYGGGKVYRLAPG